MDPDPLPRQELGIHPADGRKEGKPILIDVGDHEPNLIAMPGEHDGRLVFLSPDITEGVPQDVGAHLVYAAPDILPENLLGGLFIPGWTGGFGQGF
jgi:hypothetical protein